MAEIHKKLEPGIEKYRPNVNAGPIQYYQSSYLFAKTFYGDEIERIQKVKFEDVSRSLFFKECVWVIHATGFSSKAVGSFFGRLTEAYGEFGSLAKEELEIATDRVRKVCNNPQKIKAVYGISRILIEHDDDWEKFKSDHLNTPEKLMILPYIGKITCYHLGRNIGLLDCVKPDLHLVRLAEYWHFRDCIEMCKEMQSAHALFTGQIIPLGVIDYIVWLSCSTFGTIEIKKDGSR